MVKIVNVLKASGLYAALVFALYIGPIFPKASHLQSAAVSRSPESGHKQLGGRGSVSLSTHPDPKGSWSMEPYMPTAVTGLGGTVNYDPSRESTWFQRPN